MVGTGRIADFVVGAIEEGTAARVAQAHAPQALEHRDSGAAEKVRPFPLLSSYILIALLLPCSQKAQAVARIAARRRWWQRLEENC